MVRPRHPLGTDDPAGDDFEILSSSPPAVDRPAPGGDRRRVRVAPIFAWYDLWIGAFYDRAKRRLYIFPIPMVGIVIKFGGEA